MRPKCVQFSVQGKLQTCHFVFFVEPYLYEHLFIKRILSILLCTVLAAVFLKLLRKQELFNDLLKQRYGYFLEP